MIEFSIIQRPPGCGSPPPAVWRTCLREITFIDQRSAIPEGTPAWHDEDAYAYLLEVICGLDSPIVGETEVLHQFKAFADGLPPGPAMWRELCRLLLTDAKAIRRGHLIGLGSRSYGSAVRRCIRDYPRVALLGTGILAAEIAPYLAAPGRLIDWWGRRSAFEVALASATYRCVDAASSVFADDPTAIVIAAPASSAEIGSLARRYRQVVALIDLRAEAAQDPPPPVAPIVTLEDVFAELRQAARVSDQRVQAAKRDIRSCAAAFGARAKLNPSGWHDLCA